MMTVLYFVVIMDLIVVIVICRSKESQVYDVEVYLRYLKLYGCLGNLRP